MKKMIFVLAVICIGANSCKKCYKCSGDTSSIKLCEGSSQYDFVDRQYKAGVKKYLLNQEVMECKESI